MLSFLTGIWNGIKNVLSLFLPFAPKARSFRPSPVVRWTIVLIVLGLTLVGLFFISEWLELYLAVPTNVPWLDRLWFPLLFLLFYLVVWLAWWLWKLLTAPDEGPEFPEIEEAWNEAVQALSNAGISLTEVPVYFILGRPEAPEEYLFQAARVDLVVKQTPARASAPLHVYANREAIYITCAGASLLGKHASNLALEGLEAWPVAPEAEEAPEAVGGTLIPGATEQQSLRPGAEDQLVGEGRPATALERRMRRRLLNLSIPDLRRDPELVQELQARLEYLCRLIVRDREPYCPINGLLFLVSLGATDTDEEARKTAELAQKDFETIRSVFRMQFPVFAMLCDLETTRGFYEFIQHYTPENRLQRLGQRFPMMTDLSPVMLREQIESSVQWMCNKLLREWAYRLFKVEGSSDEDRAARTASNVRLYQFLHSMYDRERQLSLILKSSLLPDDTSPPLFYGGCYLAGTGVDKDHEQAFVRGVLDRLNKEQASVCWTEETVAQDRRMHRQATIGYIVLAAVWIVVILIVVNYFGLLPSFLRNLMPS